MKWPCHPWSLASMAISLTPISSAHTCYCSITQSGPTLQDSMDCSTPGLPAPHYLLEFAQVHVHCISDALQPSLLSPSSPSALKYVARKVCLRTIGSKIPLCISLIGYYYTFRNFYQGLLSEWKSFSCVQLFVTLWTIQSMEFPRPEYWSGFPSLGDLANPGIEPRSPILQVDSLPAEPPGKLLSELKLIMKFNLPFSQYSFLNSSLSSYTNIQDSSILENSKHLDCVGDSNTATRHCRYYGSLDTL